MRWPNERRWRLGKRYDIEADIAAFQNRTGKGDGQCSRCGGIMSSG
jgi:hypothetical protein